MNLALVCPDGLSVMLFCKGIIASMRTVPGATVYVLCEPGDYSGEIERLGAKVVPVPIYRWVSAAADFRYCRDLWRALRDNRCEAVLNFSTKPNIFGTFAARLAGARMIFMHVVGLGAGFQRRPGAGGAFLRWTFIQLYRLACRWATGIWFTNRRDRAFFIESGLCEESRTILTRNYLDTSEYEATGVDEARRSAARQLCGVQPGEKLVIMVARMIWQKGIREFVEAAERLRPTHERLRFALVAPLETGSQDAVPESFVREAEAAARFRWLGFQKDVKRLYAIADLAVLPTYYREGGYPRALLEPMAMGKPVITTDSEDCRDTVEPGRNGFLVPAKDPEALADAIARVAADDALAAELGAYSRTKAVRDFDESSIVPAALRELGLPVSTAATKAAV